MTPDIPLDAFDGEALDVVIPHALDGVRVDRALAMLTGLSRGEAHQVIDEGGVRLNDVVGADVGRCCFRRCIAYVAIRLPPENHGRE